MLNSSLETLKKSQFMLDASQGELNAYKTFPEDFPSWRSEKELTSTIEKQRLQYEKDYEYYINIYTKKVTVNFLEKLAKQGCCLLGNCEPNSKLQLHDLDKHSHFIDHIDISLIHKEALAKELDEVQKNKNDLQNYYTGLGISSLEKRNIVCKNMQDLHNSCEKEKQTQSFVDRWILPKKLTDCENFKKLEARYNEYQQYWEADSMQWDIWEEVLKQPPECHSNYTNCSMKEAINLHEKSKWICNFIPEETEMNTDTF